MFALRYLSLLLLMLPLGFLLAFWLSQAVIVAVALTMVPIFWLVVGADRMMRGD